VSDAPACCFLSRPNPSNVLSQTDAPTSRDHIANGLPKIYANHAPRNGAFRRLSCVVGGGNSPIPRRTDECLGRSAMFLGAAQITEDATPFKCLPDRSIVASRGGNVVFRCIIRREALKKRGVVQTCRRNFLDACGMKYGP
jgi:hypothetical protein